jgi:biopolymer transport protein ExbD
MSWKIRHQGSPRSIEGLTLPEVEEGLQDGLWEPTDEVTGPSDSNWVHIEDHPQLAELAADIEPPPPKVHDDETHLDMNALIDVCLVLLIFFILVTSYAALQKMLDLPSATAAGAKGPLVVTKEKVKEVMIHVKVQQENGKPVIRVEDRVVEKGNLTAVLRSFVRGEQHKTELLIEHDKDVPHGIIVAIQDAAKGAGVEQLHLLIPPEELKAK